MFTIRKQHLEACAEVAMRNFEDRVREHLRGSYPDQVKALGEEQTRAVVKEGIERARGFGLLTEADVVLFIEVMVLLGRDFDTDPRYPWGREILEGLDQEDPTTKAERLRAKASEAVPAPARA